MFNTREFHAVFDPAKFLAVYTYLERTHLQSCYTVSMQSLNIVCGESGDTHTLPAVLSIHSVLYVRSSRVLTDTYVP